MPEDKIIKPEQIETPTPEQIETLRPEQMETRSASTITHLTLEGAGVAGIFVAPFAHDIKDKLTGPKDEGQKLILPPGVDRPE